MNQVSVRVRCLIAWSAAICVGLVRVSQIRACTAAGPYVTNNAGNVWVEIIGMIRIRSCEAAKREVGLNWDPHSQHS